MKSWNFKDKKNSDVYTRRYRFLQIKNWHPHTTHCTTTL